ncbi:FAD-binding domain-containing protein [Undibacterium curvum]|uniref:FAD-binding domain-containing protein n=1 Tax=Undibacterium curvum TaxID=2762294 RepID=UPI003D13B155
MTYSIVWFKRDLRTVDHAPLIHAAQNGPLLCLYIVEPSLWQQEDVARQHYLFVYECLRDLARQLRICGAELRIELGEATEVLTRIHTHAAFDALLSHEETGNAVSYARDKAVARWCRAHQVRWREWPQHGVVRPLTNRDLWHKQWQSHMQLDCLAAPDRASLLDAGLPWMQQRWPDAAQFGLADHDPPLRQRGGRALALQVLDEFLIERSSGYRGGISSPLTAPSACSRLSPYLSFGCLSMREVVQATRQRLHQLSTQSHAAAAWQRKGLEAFLSRLHWHCHFIQKLESEPELEMLNLHRGYDGLREADWNPDHFAALQAGRTGWPMVDACVAMLRETGWINFRMRAMLVSVASYPLWLHWRPVGLWLARQFLDYEPGIHWSQMQMQAGTTGINTARVYNPLKQAQDHDPEGKFVRRWLPAMRRVPDTWLLQPWSMPIDVQQRCGVILGQDIALPCVNLEQASRDAKARLYAVRARPEVRAGKAAIVEKHASRLLRQPARNQPSPAAVASQQSFDF